METAQPTYLPGWQSCHAGKHFLTMAERGLPCVMCAAERCPTCVKYARAVGCEMTEDHPYTVSVLKRMWQHHTTTVHRQ